MADEPESDSEVLRRLKLFASGSNNFESRAGSVQALYSWSKKRKHKKLGIPHKHPKRVFKYRVRWQDAVTGTSEENDEPKSMRHRAETDDPHRPGV